ncbi:MAG TPA: class I SAM-dependent methyltransferase [Bryobacteraceae bacterium]|jgi:SAM-dependent methyltransferase|nr:class I SAM-dependent methyltransferase [Bryobacteraceae bacterium]
MSAREQFLSEYRYIRYAEGRGSDSSDYYRALPYRDLSGRLSTMWAMRAKTYRYFETRILRPIARKARRPLRILDLGAGNCWMSYRLSLGGHRPVAVDIFDDERDGLRAAHHYGHWFPVLQADFDDLPFPSGRFDLAIYNSSLHYSTNYRRTLAEAKRCLSSSGWLIVLDSPIYRRREHGLRMVEERHSDFLKRYGFRSDAIPSVEFLDLGTLRELSEDLGVRWRVRRPWYGWRWHLRPYAAWLKRRRPPSRFWILAGQFESK